MPTDVRQSRRVEAYRRAHSYADRWARGNREIHHTVETQDRVFRMVEQLLASRPQLATAQLFQVLRALDDGASWEIAPSGLPTATSASAMALVGYKIVFGTQPALASIDWPSHCEVADEAEAELAVIGLRSQGFDPVVFNGTDPAAFLWALFEIDEREAASEPAVDPDRRRCGPRGLAVVPTTARRQTPAPRIPPPLPLGRVAELAGIAR